MNKNKVIIVASLLIAHAGFASANREAVTVLPPVHQQNTSNVTKVAPDNPDRKIIEAAIQEIVSAYKKPAYKPPHMAEPMQIETPALARLFPKHRFYVIRWDMVADLSTPEGRMVSVAGDLYFTLVVRPQGESVRLGGYGNYEDFGLLLRANAVKIKSADDAKLIWTAFNDAHQKKGFGQRTHRQVSPTEWALGENQIDNFNYWYQVTLDTEQTVVSAKLMAEEVKKQRPPK